LPIKKQIEARLTKHVDVLAGLIGERNTRRPSALAATRSYILKQLHELGLNSVEYRYQVPDREAVNIEITLQGRRPNLPSLVVGAHYDTAATTPGADDNASAVATLLEIIAALHDKKLRRSVRCVFYDCEEPPHFATQQMGSFQHAKMLKDRNEEIHGMICLESIGYFPRRVESRVYRPKFIHWIDSILGGRYVVIVSDIRSILFGAPFVLRFLSSGFFRCLAVALPESVGIHGLSDNRSYWVHGYRALMVTNTAMFRNPNYHQPSDLPATLDYRRLTKLTIMITRVIQRTCS
jgi:hypothetical protein